MIFRFLEASDAHSNTIGDIESLLTQLTGRRVTLSREHFGAVACRSIWLAAMEEGSEIVVGIATLVPVRIPTGFYGRIEDVVVKNSYRGKGIGRKLMELLVAEARRLNMDWLTLTSKPERDAANHLYRDLGFERHETNNYRLVLSSRSS
jgi:phosphinothricin acetyltransferase